MELLDFALQVKKLEGELHLAKPATPPNLFRRASWYAVSEIVQSRR